METVPLPSNEQPGFEQSLVRRAQAGEILAFEDLYRQHVGRVHALCLRMSRSGTEAEELTQRTFVRAWEKLGSFRAESKLSTWLHRIAVNVVLEDRRSRERRESRIIPEDPSDLERSAAAPPGGEEARDLENAIRSLPPAARLVFVLHDIEGYKHREIARLTGRATGTCKAQLHRARRLLREALET
jgi:RNA polymerase sigma-70 factor (ECF subfamily)